MLSSILRLLVCLLLVGAYRVSSACAELSLFNSHVTVTFSSTGGIRSFQHRVLFPSPIDLLSDNTIITLDDEVALNCPTLLSTLVDATSATFTYQCPLSQPF